MDNQENTGIVSSIEHAGAAVLQVVEHPITSIEHVAGEALAGVEAAGAAVKVELESLVDKVKTYFHSTSAGHLQDALVAIAARLEALESTVTDLRAFVGK